MQARSEQGMDGAASLDGPGGAPGQEVAASQETVVSPAAAAPARPGSATGSDKDSVTGTDTGSADSAAGSADSAAGSALSRGQVPGGPLIRASDRERDDVLRTLQDAFAEGRLGDEEFDERMRSALAARTRADLDQLLADLPVPGPGRQVARAANRPSADWPAEGRFAIAIKGSVRRGGRWRVPQRLTTFAYKGSSHVDLRAAELTAPVTAIRAVGYKSDVEIVVPPGVRVVTGGLGVSRGLPDDGQEGDLPQDAPVLHVRGFAYKGRIEIRARPRSR